MGQVEAAIEAKMKRERIAPPTTRAFLNAVHRVAAGDKGLIPEATIEPVENLTPLDALPAKADAALLKQLAVIKLNGGLGTGMGLDRAKALLPVKGSDTFLDFIARQILRLRREQNSKQPACSRAHTARKLRAVSGDEGIRRPPQRRSQIR